MPHETPVSELEESATLLYRREKYTEAIKDINRIATRSRNALSMEMMDILAKCHQKAGEHDQALQKAKELIRRFEQEPVGYHRACRMLVDMHKPERAVLVYERGLKTVPEDHPGFPEMQSKYKSLLARLFPPKKVDPLDHLPLDVVRMILEYLPFKTIVRCCRVSKPWRALLTSLPSLWTTLDFRGAGSTATRGYASKKFVSDCLNRSKNSVHTAHLVLKGVVPALSALCSRSRGLHSLSIQSSVLLIEMPQVSPKIAMARNLVYLFLGPSVEISPYHIGVVWKECTRLETLIIFKVEHDSRDYRISSPLEAHATLKRLDMTASYVPPEIARVRLDMTALLRNASELRHLHLSNFEIRPHNFPWSVNFGVDLSRQKQLEYLDIDVEALDLQNISSTITHLNLRSHRLNDAPDYPHLEHLTCRSFAVAERQLHTVSSAPAMLKSLTITNFPPEDFDDPIVYHYRMAELEKIQLDDSIGMDSSLVPEIIRLFPKLQAVGVRNTDVTGVGLKALVLGLPHLQQIDIVICAHVSSDAIDWARDQGIKVLHRPSVW